MAYGKKMMSSGKGSMGMPSNGIMKGKGKCKYAPKRLVMNSLKK